MTRKQTEQYAFDAISSGFNCAETLVRTGTASLGITPSDLPSRVATGFGGGLARSKAELCGALAGGTMVLGFAYGRDNAEASSEAACAAAAAFRERFIALHGSSCCGKLLETFGEQENWSACKRLVAETAGLLHDVITEMAGEIDRPTFQAGSPSLGERQPV